MPYRDSAPQPTAGLKVPDFAAAWFGVSFPQVGLPAVRTEARSRGHGLAHVVAWMSAGPPPWPACPPGDRHRPAYRALPTLSPNSKHTPTEVQLSDFTRLPDLALRSYGGSVLSASDESFAERQALIRPGAPAFQPETFGASGQLYDGWETRRRRHPAHDWAIVRLGMAGIVRGVVVDTAWFKGNYPPFASVEACEMGGHPSVEELRGAAWVEIVPRSPLTGDARHEFAVEEGRRFTHVRLNIFPDGGVARLRVHGEVVPDLTLFSGMTIDLAALENGAMVTACSNEFYSSPSNVIAPGLARHQAEGWETARRRDGGNDWLILRLAVPGVVRLAELDTVNLVYNAPGSAALTGADASEGEPGPDTEWFELLPRTRLQPDTRHRFRLAGDRLVTHVRLDIFPDGGLTRLRLHGTPG